MSYLKITIKGDTPSKKNENKVTCSGKFPRTYKSKRYRDWYQQVSEAFKMPRGHDLPLKTTHSTTLSFWGANKRKWDLTNRAESIMDFLVDMGVLEDDNYEVCPCVQMVYMGVSRTNPRCEVEIDY